MKFDIVKQIDDYLVRVNRKPLTEAHKDALNEINESGFPELRCLHMRSDENNDANKENCVYFDFYSRENGDPDFLIEDKKITLRTSTSYSLHIEYDIGDEAIIREFMFNKGEDVIVFLRNEKSKDYLLELFIDGKSYTIKDGVSLVECSPELVCSLRKGYNTNGRDCYIVSDPSARISTEPFDKNICFGIGGIADEELRSQDMQSKLRTFRAIGEKVCELYHENYLWDGKTRVLSKGKMGKVKLEG